MLSRDASGLAAHWSSIMGVPVTAQDRRHVINVGDQTITIVSAPGVTRERLDAMVLSCAAPPTFWRRRDRWASRPTKTRSRYAACG